MKMKTILIIGGIGVLLCVCLFVVIIGIAVVGGLGMTQPTADVGEKFMTALKTGDYDTAYGLCHPALQQKLGGASGLKRLVESGKAQPSKWNFSSRNVNNDEGTLEGTVTMAGGEGTVKLELVKVGSDWKIVSFNLK
ncbi:hypothetical protein ANRL3_00617 [Anaerolineae bacterium]|nr:hypothetical protein ANRL3_00617 [Anaerolineae bacterium]